MYREKRILKRSSKNTGFILPLVLVALLIISLLAVGTMMSSYGNRIDAVKTKAQTEAMLAAEAGYEQGIFWMCQQGDILGAIQAGGGSGNIDFGTSTAAFNIGFQNFLGARPVFNVKSVGKSGRPVFSREVDVSVVQETAGWAMGACQVPYGSTTTGAVNFVSGEVINMPLHINEAHDNPDNMDIFITGSPKFLQRVEMGESRRKTSGTDKYSGSISLFQGGIVFDQPDVRITDEAAVQSKVNRFRDSTLEAFKFTPRGDANIPYPTSAGYDCNRFDAVQLEFFTQGGVGKVRINNNCTVLGYRRNNDDKTWDFNTVPGSGGHTFKRYYIYAYHYKPPDPCIIANITDTYVSQHLGGYTSAPGGQIYVNGNVIIGSGDTSLPDQNMVVNGKITVVATGNIWIGDSIRVDGTHDITVETNGVPFVDNPVTEGVDESNLNVLGLIAQGVVKVVDPGISDYGTDLTHGSGSPKYYPYDPNSWVMGKVDGSKKHVYQPIGNKKNVGDAYNVRCLPHNTIIEASITVGGGGWGAENVQRTYSGTDYGGRKEYNNGNASDFIVLHGSITEVIRGVVGLGSDTSWDDGYLKRYYIDNRLMSGILPADIWFTGKFIPASAGWHDKSLDY